MASTLARVTSKSSLGRPLPLSDQQAVAAALSASVADNTKKAYACDWKHWSAWCARRRLEPFPAAPEAVAAYAADMAKRLALSTVQRRLAAVSVLHSSRGVDSPCKTELVRRTLRGLRRLNRRPVAQKAALDLPVLKKMLAKLPPNCLGNLRDRALLLLGYATALRRSNLSALVVADLRWREDRLDVTIRRSKTDQEGRGRVIGVVKSGDPSICAVTALRAWLRAAHIKEGPVFRPVRGNRAGDAALGVESIRLVVKAAAEAAGLDASTFGAHSLRAGHITEAANRGAPPQHIMKTTGHSNVEMVMRYVRNVDAVRGSSATSIWTR